MTIRVAHDRTAPMRHEVIVGRNRLADHGQREELLRVASKCPIHELMTEVKTEISTSLAG